MIARATRSIALSLLLLAGLGLLAGCGTGHSPMASEPAELGLAPDGKLLPAAKKVKTQEEPTSSESTEPEEDLVVIEDDSGKTTKTATMKSRPSRYSMGEDDGGSVWGGGF